VTTTNEMNNCCSLLFLAFDDVNYRRTILGIASGIVPVLQTVVCIIVESKNDPNGSKIEMTSLDPNTVPSYPFTNNAGNDINPSNTNVNVNTSHSIN
jgi:hypothetical protein